MEQPENFFPDMKSLPEPAVEDRQEGIEEKWEKYKNKEERSFLRFTVGSLLLHASFIALLFFSPSFREIIETYLGIHLPVFTGEKIFVSVLDPSQIHLSNETRSSMLTKGYSLNGQPIEHGYQNILSKPANSPPTNHATVSPRAQVLPKHSVLPSSRALMLRQYQEFPHPKRLPQYHHKKQNMISEEPNASLSPRHGSRVQQNIPSRRAKNPSGNSTPQKISPLRNRRRHIPTDEFPDQLNRHHTIKPSVRHLVNRTASIPRHVILPSKQVRSSRVAPTSVAKNGLRAKHTITSNGRQDMRKKSVPLPLVAKSLRSHPAIFKASATLKKKKTIPQVRTISRENKVLEHASLGDMQRHHTLLSNVVNSTYSMRTKLSKGSTINEADAAYSSYIKEIDRKFEEIGKFPRNSVKNNVTGENRLTFTILKDGTLSDLRVVQSSDHSSLDEESLRIVQDAAPFQPIPALLKKDALTLTWIFHYSEGAIHVKR
ncbi:energy transducer TonB [Leptospirillum sp. Group II 'CF-1']|uniref:energy transducer TonB n=1 Tax=Leptospirillum sp. Group II 'CF-1' TaxID=1660083 RepID=UPI000A8919A2|nr:energy transducer TonB [Leptospirillum sp. Group II 'CF-1']